MNKSFSGIHTLQVEGSLFIISDIDELDALMQRATATDLESIKGFSAPSRKRERLAWRIALRQVLGENFAISYTPSGAPQIENTQFSHISVSHCADKVCIALSQQPCGVDIERTDRKFESLAPRYMSAEELQLADTSLAKAAVWCAKEALYKMTDEKGLELRTDIAITKIDLAEATITGQVKQGKELIMRIIMPDAEHIAVYSI